MRFSRLATRLIRVRDAPANAPRYAPAAALESESPRRWLMRGADLANFAVSGYLDAAPHTVSMMSRVTLYGSQLALGRLSSM